MANAKQCDRCESLYKATIYVPAIRINKDNHPYGDTWIDLCPNCQSQLERWLKREIAFEERKRQ